MTQSRSVHPNDGTKTIDTIHSKREIRDDLSRKKDESADIFKIQEDAIRVLSTHREVHG